eukprot:Em0004g1303a
MESVRPLIYRLVSWILHFQYSLGAKLLSSPQDLDGAYDNSSVIVLGSVIQLFCSASGQITAPHMQWTRNNITIPETAQLPHLMVKSKIENNTITSLLTIFGFSASDNGSYQCIASDSDNCTISQPLLLSDVCLDSYSRVTSKRCHGNNPTTIRWCQKLKLLPSSKMCSCGRGMHLVKRKDSPELLGWRCPRKGSHLEIQVILRLLHLWSTKTPVGKAQDEVKVGSATAVDWYNFIRDICIQFFIDHPAVVGGPGKEVEIDESKFGKRKYNRGRAVEGHWVFGGMERGSGESFLVEVARRDAATLLPIIAQHVRPGTTVYSDEWAAYHQLSTATGNVHLTVNHSLHFVDPVTGAHTQGVESMWSSCKRMMREERAMNSLLFDTYLPEFMWRRKFGGPVAFGHILKHISEQYPV